MQTPDTVEGRLTERIMERVSGKLELSTSEYNAIWSAVLETLQKELRLEFGNPGVPWPGLSRKEFLGHGGLGDKPS